MSDQPFDLSVLPGLPPPGSILVIRGADFEDDDDARRAIFDFYAGAARAGGVPSGTPAAEVIPLIMFLPPEGEAVVWSEDIDAQMAALGWVRKP